MKVQHLSMFMLVLTLVLLTLFPIFCIKGMLEYIDYNTTNHTGVDYLIVLWPLGFCAILSWLILRYQHKKNKVRYSIIPFVVNIGTIGFFLFIDHFNIMVQTDEWYQRSMPDPFGASVRKKRDTPVEIDEMFRAASRDLNSGKISQDEFRRKIEFAGDEMRKAKDKFYEQKINPELEKEYSLWVGKFVEGKIHYEEYITERIRLEKEYDSWRKNQP